MAEENTMKGYHITIAQIMFIMLFVVPGYPQEDAQQHAVCEYCNMDREKFAHTRMLIEYSDGTAAATCSLHCSAMDLIHNRTKIPCRIMVGDYGSKKLIDATAAFWVIGGDKPGVMTDTGKWAFEHQAETEDFVKKHGGKPATFQEALKAAYEGLYEDMKRTIDRVEARKSGGWNPCAQLGR
jgi:nitrous oxide reductase accessory protein NosL